MPTKAQMRQKALIESVLRELNQIAIVDSVRTMDSILIELNKTDNTPIVSYECTKAQWARLGIQVPEYRVWIQLGAEVHTTQIIRKTK